MTVSASTSRADYTGNGTTTAFSVPFYFLDNSHLKVIKTSIAGIATTLVLTTDYSVSGAGVLAGGTVTTVTAPAAGEKLSILRNVPVDQQTNYVPNDPFPAESHEAALDKLTMIAQQANEGLNRAMILPQNSSGVSAVLPTPQANKVIAWNETATGLQSLDPGSLASIVAYGTAKADVFSGDGVTTQFVLSSNPGALNNLDVSISGVTQRNTLDFTLSGGTSLVFSSAPPAGTNNVLARYLQGLPQGYSDSDAAYFIQTGTAAITRTAQNKLRDVFHVNDFGVVGNGIVDDTTALQAALTAAAGKTLNVGDGLTFMVSASIVPSSNTKIVGSSKLFAKANSIAGPVIDCSNKSGITINGIEIDANAANLGAYHGIQLLSGSNNTVINCYIHDTLQAGIRAGEESNLIISDNRVINCGRVGYTDNHGIMVYSTTSTSSDVVVAENIVKSAYRKGITLYQASPGIVDGVSIVNNIVTDCGLGGIFVSNPSAAVHGLFKNITVSGNRCSDNYVNIEADCMDGGAVSGNTCNTTTGGSGIYSADSQYLTISSNSVVSSSADGIKMIGITVTPKGNVFADNVVALSSQAGVGSYSGILLHNVQYSIVTSNAILGESSSPKQSKGISEIGTSDYNVYTKNQIANVYTSAVGIIGTSSVFHTLSGKNCGINSEVPANTLDITGGISIRDQAITLTNGANNNVALPTNSGVLYVAGPTGAYNVTGIAGGSKGRKLTICNYTTQTLTINHNNAGSSAGNKILIGGAADLAIGAYGAVELTYINGASAWFITGYKS